MCINELLDNIYVEYRVSGRELILEVCPYCTKKKHLYVSADNGAFICHRCGEAGNLRRLMEELKPGSSVSFSRPKIQIKLEPQRYPEQKLVDYYHGQLLSNMNAMGKLYRLKGFTKDTIRKARIGIAKNGAYTFPHLENGIPVCVKYFKYDNNGKSEKYRYKGGKSVPWNIDCLPYITETAIIAEGEIDGATLLQLGYDNVTANTLGANSFPDTWVHYYKDINKIIVFYDNDLAGLHGSYKTITKLKPICSNIHIIHPPLKYNDINEWYKAEGDSIKAEIDKKIKELERIK